MHTCIYICTYVYVYIHIYVQVYVDIRLYVRIHVCIYTHIYYIFSYSRNKHFSLSPFTPKKNLKLNREISNSQGLFDAGKRKIAQRISVQQNLTFFLKVKIKVGDKLKIDVQKHCNVC